jgi:hypothetical protein
MSPTMNENSQLPHTVLADGGSGGGGGGGGGAPPGAPGIPPYPGGGPPGTEPGGMPPGAARTSFTAPHAGHEKRPAPVTSNSDWQRPHRARICSIPHFSLSTGDLTLVGVDMCWDRPRRARPDALLLGAALCRAVLRRALCPRVRSDPPGERRIRPGYQARSSWSDLMIVIAGPRPII